MNQVVSTIRALSELIVQVSAASDEQAAGIENVNHSITSMEEGAQRNAVLVQQAAAATTSLEDQARSLASAVGAFKLEDSATTATAGEPVVAMASSKRSSIGLPQTPPRLTR